MKQMLDPVGGEDRLGREVQQGEHNQGAAPGRGTVVGRNWSCHPVVAFDVCWERNIITSTCWRQTPHESYELMCWGAVAAGRFLADAVATRGGGL